MTTAATQALGRRLETLAFESGLDLGAYARERLGRNRTTFYKWRRGDLPRSLAVLLEIAEAEGVSLDWLVGRTDTREVRP